MLTVLAVVSDDHFRIWLEATAPLAEWLVAGGTAALALATYALARRAAEDGLSTPTDELERLADLQTRGALTDEEFAAAKARLLGL